MSYEKRNLNRIMPALTVEGRRDILSIALHTIGEKAILKELAQFGISSIHEAKDKVRKLPAKVFRSLYREATQ